MAIYQHIISGRKIEVLEGTEMSSEFVRVDVKTTTKQMKKAPKTPKRKKSTKKVCKPAPVVIPVVSKDEPVEVPVRIEEES